MEEDKRVLSLVDNYNDYNDLGIDMMSQGIKLIDKVYSEKFHMSEMFEENQEDNETELDSDGRILLYPTSRKHVLKKNNYTCKINGLIIDTYTHSILSIPPQIINSKPLKSIINRHLCEYRYIRAIDGTNINIYWWPREKRWCISTTRGLDVANVSILNSKITYMDALEYALKTCGIKSFNKLTKYLDIKNTYSLIIVHPEVHLYWKSNAIDRYIYLSQITDNSSMYISYIWPKGNYLEHKIMPQQIVSFTSANSDKFNPITLTTLKNICTNQPANWKCSVDLPFGLIMVSESKKVPVNHRRVFIPSTTYNTLYNRYYRRTLFPFYSTDKTYKREKYVKMLNYLNRSVRKDIEKILPHLIEEYIIYDNKMEILIKRIRGKLLADINDTHKYIESVRKDEIKQRRKSIGDITYEISSEQYMEEISNYCKDKLEKFIAISNNTNTHIDEIIDSYMYHEKMIIMLYKYLD